MNYKILPLLCLASALMLLGCYKIEKMEGGKTARINTVTGETVVISNDGSAVVVDPVTMPSPLSAEGFMALKTITCFFPASGNNLIIKFEYRYREDRLEYKISVDIREATFIQSALMLSVNSISVVLQDAQGFEVTRIPLRNLTAIVDSNTNEASGVFLQDSMAISLSDFKRISMMSYWWIFTQEFAAEMNDWRLKAEAKKSKSAATIPPK